MRLLVLLFGIPLAACGGQIDQGGGARADEAGLAGCNDVTNVLVYAQYDPVEIGRALAARADRCTQYYLSLPALAADHTQPRGPSVPAQIRALGPRFHAMAEFSFSGWREWIAASPGTRDWELAGRVFRERMSERGYDVAAGDTWELNELPSTIRSGQFGVWDHARQAIKGLYEGGRLRSRGLVFIAGMGQDLANVSAYKANLERWLVQSSFWSDMDRHVRWWGQEVYADPHNTCVPGSSVLERSAQLSAYLEHIPRLAAAGPPATTAANYFLDRAYVPIFNAAFGTNVGYGNNVVPLSAFDRFERLEIFATHFWAAYHGYPGRQVGFGWAPSQTAPQAEKDALAATLAHGIAAAYPTDGFWNLAKYACATDGSLAGCACDVAGARYNAAWGTFGTW